MHRGRSVSGGDDEAPFETHWRLGTCCVHGKEIIFPVQPFDNVELTPRKEYDLQNTQSIEESVRHSDVVYNLVGRTYPTKYALPLRVSMS